MYRKDARIALGLLLILNVLAGALMFLLPGDTFAAEGGVVETVQLLACAAAAGLFGFALTLLPRTGDIPGGAAALRTGTISLFVIALIALFREIDFRQMPGPVWLHSISDPTIRDTVVLGGLFVLLAFLARNWRHFAGWWRLLVCWYALPLWIGGILLFVAAAVLDPILRFENSVIVEELVEMNGFALILWAAARHARLAVTSLVTSEQRIQPARKVSANAARLAYSA